MNKNYEFAYKTLFSDEEQPLILENDRNVRIEFEQIFAMQRGEELYCILRPIACVEGLRPHAALVFSVDEEGVFRAVQEQRLSEEIFAEYYSALQKTQRGRNDE